MKKIENIILRVTPNEKAFIKAKADLKDFKNVSDFILSSLIYPEVFDKKRMVGMLYEVNKIGVNLNQITYKVNKNKEIDLKTYQLLIDELKEIDTKLEMTINTFKSI